MRVQPPESDQVLGLRQGQLVAREGVDRVGAQGVRPAERELPLLGQGAAGAVPGRDAHRQRGRGGEP